MSNIFKELLELKNKSYCPYSSFWVSAIAIASTKKYYGVNIENAAYPVGICAERVAISNAIMDGNDYISEIHLLTKSNGFGMPCGMCRQFMSEFMKSGAKIFVYNTKGERKQFNIDDLLLERFQKTDLC